jgi:hypothetical protein
MTIRKAFDEAHELFAWAMLLALVALRYLDLVGEAALIGGVMGAAALVSGVKFVKLRAPGGIELEGKPRE